MSRFTSTIYARGPAGNVFAILGAALSMMRRLNLPLAEIETFRTRVMDAGSYRKAVTVVREYFPVDLGDDEDEEHLMHGAIDE